MSWDSIDDFGRSKALRKRVFQRRGLKLIGIDAKRAFTHTFGRMAAASIGLYPTLSHQITSL